MKKIAVLASHNGTGFEALYQASKSGKLNIEIVLIISNNSEAPVLQKAQQYKINSYVVNQKTSPNVDEKIANLLQDFQCDFVFLSGYMKKISPLLTRNFKIINAHPSLLPKFGGAGMYGRYVHEAVIKAKEKQSGVTIHEVNEHYDEGKILLQKKLNLADDETVESLESKIKLLEQKAIVETFQNLILTN